jgi:hypothetical protein
MSDLVNLVGCILVLPVMSGSNTWMAVPRQCPFVFSRSLVGDRQRLGRHREVIPTIAIVLGQHRRDQLLNRHHVSACPEHMGRKRMARAAPMAVLQSHAVIIMTAMKHCLERLDADTFRFLGIAVRFLDLPDHARVHTIVAPFICRRCRNTRVSEKSRNRLQGGSGPKTRTAPRRVRQRCCPLLMRYVVT